MSTAVQQILNALGSVLKWWVVVSPWEQGLRVRWGRHVKLLTAGVHLRLPLIDRAYIQSTRRRFSAVPTQTLTMSDGKTVTVAGSLGYTIVDIERLYATLHHAEATLEAEAQGLISAYLVANSYETFSPDDMKHYVETNLDFDRYGIGEVEFVVTTFVCTKTYRLLMGEPRDYTMGEILNTKYAEGEIEV